MIILIIDRRSENLLISITLRSQQYSVMLLNVANGRKRTIQLFARLHCGRITVQTIKLVYQCDKLNNKILPEWEKHQMAGEGWLRMFQKRNPLSSLCKPESTRLSRSTLLNRSRVSEYFTNYQDVLDRLTHIFQRHQIWNVDEAGINTVHVPPQVFAEKKSKQVGGMASA
ncbi:hypothetical protein PR048_004904 [Dryococelus australis]|uniref:Transposase n=1 Tax=Dryococelus australis TaxID=614101 RepID=A0ABQ9I6Q3_9NEOP|nr:hypothetical protein PR048_004904 [Dryococelus australis]